MTSDFVEVGGEGLHFLELEDADDGWPCATLIDELGNVTNATPPDCLGIVEYPAHNKRRLIFCSEYCAGIAGLVRYRRGVVRERRHERRSVGPSILTALWRKESDLLAGSFYKPHLTGAQREEVFVQKGRVCLECGQPATDVDHIVPGGGDELWNLQPLCQTCHLAKTAKDGNRGPAAPAVAKASIEKLESLLDEPILRSVRTSGIPMLAVSTDKQTVRYVSYLTRVYSVTPRICDDREWATIERSIRSRRRSEL